MNRKTSQTKRASRGSIPFLIAGMVLLLIAAIPGGFLLDGGGFPTPTPTAAPALAPVPLPSETPTLIPVESIFPAASPTFVVLPGSDQQSLGADSFVASAATVEEESQGGFNLLLLGIPILGVLSVLVVVVGFYVRRSRELG